MTTAAEIEAAFLALPPADREPLLTRLEQVHGDDAADAPQFTPEQVAMVRERVAALDRGEVELIPVEETLRRGRAIIEAARRRQEGDSLVDAA